MNAIGNVRLRIGCLILLGVFCQNALAQDIQLQASVNAEKIGLDDTLVYQITFKGVNNPPQPDLSALTDFRILQTSRSSEFQFINGAASYLTHFSYYLSANKTGKLTLPPVSVQYNGKEYKSEALQIEVVKGALNPQPAQQQNPRSLFDDDFFNSAMGARREPTTVDVQLRAIVAKKNIFRGEGVLFTVQLLTRNRISTVNMISGQSFEGFWQEWFPVPQSISGASERINDKNYQVFDIRKAILFPSRTGDVVIPSLQFEIMLDTGSFGFFSNSAPLRRSTPELKINVSELPRQAGDLPVGRFQFSLAPERKEININNLLTLKMAVTGNGNVKTVKLPELPATPEYSVYPAKIATQGEPAGDQFQGKLTAEIPIAFKKAGAITFPAAEFRYFNPLSASIVTLKSAPFTITVTGVREQQERANTLMQSEIVQKGEDIEYILRGDINDQARAVYANWWFWVLWGVPFTVMLGLAARIYVWQNWLSLLPLFTRRRVLQHALRRLQKATTFGAVFNILEEYVSQKTGIGRADINQERIADVCQRCGVDAEISRLFQQTWAQAEMANFSQQKKTPHALRLELGAVAELLGKIDPWIKP